ncbi:MAG: hypothetical protein J0I32_02950 [Sphingobacteriales bacterium]|nr:hypothetical protein [Sphingobacteriales bacterium]OJW04967.1 MAG: hypothetical protein BGO52_21005 [Sphingobacteriales bacterium 44-61]
MKKLFFLFLLIASAIAVNAQIRKVPAQPTQVQIIKAKTLAINPAVLATRKVELGRSSFTNPSFTRALTNDNINVTYKLRPVSLSDNSGSAIEASPASPPANQPAKPGYTCTYSREKVTVNSTDFLSVSYTGEGLYPGAIYKYDDFYKGNFKSDVQNWQRNPIIISSDAAHSVTINDPTTQLSDAVVNFKAITPADPGSIVTSQYTYASNSTSMMLNATAGGAYAGFSGQAGFNFNKSDSSIYITYDFRKILFTLSASVPQNGFFTEAAKEQTPNMVWLGSVSYGARVMANVKINASQLKIGANAQFQYGDPKKAGFQAAAEFKDNNQSLSCTVNIYSVGLPGNATLVGTITTTLAELDRQVLNALNAVTSQSAKPVMYSLYSMAGERIAVESATDYYISPLCMPANDVYHLVDASVEIITGAGGFDDKLEGSVGRIEFRCCNGGSLVGYDQNNLKIGPKDVTTFFLKKSNTIIFEDLRNARMDIIFTPKYILGVPDAWRIVGATLTMNFANQNGTPYAKNPVKLAIPGVGSGVTLTKEKPILSCPILYNGGTSNGGFMATSPNQH